MSDTPEWTVAELQASIDHELEEARGRIAAYDERSAIQAEAREDGLTTDQRAVAAPKRPERFHGEHDVAQAWLKTSTTARLWTRKGV